MKIVNVLNRKNKSEEVPNGSFSFYYSINGEKYLIRVHRERNDRVTEELLRVTIAMKTKYQRSHKSLNV